VQVLEHAPEYGDVDADSSEVGQRSVSRVHDEGSRAAIDEV
jgi:hypothetical protein